MKNSKKNVGWLIAAAVLAIAAVLLLIYVVVRTAQSDRAGGRNSEINSIAHGSQAETDPSPVTVETDLPETTASADPPVTAPPVSSDVPPETTLAPETSARPVETTGAPETTAPPPETTVPPVTEAPPQTTAAPETTASPVTTSPPSPDGIPAEFFETINFAALQAINPDVYAWISIPGTSVDYPVLCRREGDDPDNPYYLKHDIDGNSDGTAAHSAIFSENFNSADFTDFLTVIYGHAMRDGSMFADLLNYRDRDFFEKYPWIIVYTPEKTLIYKVFSACKFDERHLLRNYDWTSLVNRVGYYPWLKNTFKDMNSNFANVTVGISDRILALSCCTFVEGNRFLVQGLLVEER